MNQHTSSFHGASGAEYDYCVFSKGFKPNDDQYYNYMFASLSPEGNWLPVFIGQGDLKQYLSDRLHVRSIAPAGSSHVLAHMNPDGQRRRMEALDMLASHPQVHAFTGCNRDSLESASHLNASKTQQRVPAAGKSARRFFPDDGVLKNFSQSPQSLDTVWARLRKKI
jgi:hypothetical protein